MSFNSAVVSEVRRYRRLLVGEFMDSNPGVFATPTSAPRWIEFFEQVDVVDGADRLPVEKALGMFAHLFRQTQFAMLNDAPMRLEEFLSDENFPGIEEVVEPDPVALLIVGGEDATEHTNETLAFARTMSVFKFLVRSGKMPADFMFGAISQRLDDLQGDSPMQRSLVDAVKQMVQRDMETVLRIE